MIRWPRVAMVTGAACLLSGGSGLFSTIDWESSSPMMSNPGQWQLPTVRATMQWRELLEATDKFKPAKIAVAPVTEDDANDQANDQDSGEQHTPKGIETGLLVGIVQSPEDVALIIPPLESGAPERVVRGSGWLAPWILDAVSDDHVIWKNTSDGTRYRQTLFPEATTEGTVDPNRVKSETQMTQGSTP